MYSSPGWVRSGSWRRSRCAFGERTSTDWMSSTRIPFGRAFSGAWAMSVDGLITHRLPYTDFVDALSHPPAGEIKTVLEWATV